MEGSNKYIYIQYNISNFVDDIIQEKYIEIRKAADKKYDDYSYKFDRKILAQDQKMNEILNENKRIVHHFDNNSTSSTIINNLSNKTLDYKIISQIISKNNTNMINNFKQSQELVINSISKGIIKNTENIMDKINITLLKFQKLNENYIKLFNKYNENNIINNLQKLFKKDKNDISMDYNSVMNIICSLENKLELTLKLINKNSKQSEVKKYNK